VEYRYTMNSTDGPAGDRTIRALACQQRGVQ
jgi:hypothetical protein